MMGIIPILVIDCRLPRSVIPAKLVLSIVEGAGIQTLPVGHCVQLFRQFLTVIGIIRCLTIVTFVLTRIILKAVSIILVLKR